MAWPSGRATEGDLVTIPRRRTSRGALLLDSFAMHPSDPDSEPHDAAPRTRVVDETLLDTLLAMSPEERLRLNDRMALTIQELRDGFAAAEPDHAARPAGGQRD